jgi:hypothetical protein
MRTTLLALTLAVAFTAPAFAEPEKAAEPKPTTTQEEAAKKATSQDGDNWETCAPAVQDDNGGCE